MASFDKFNRLQRTQKKKRTRFAKLLTWKQKVSKELHDDHNSEHYGRASTASDYELSLTEAFRMYSESMNNLTRINAISK